MDDNKKTSIFNAKEKNIYKSSNISIICPSPKGKEVALKLQRNLNAKLYIKENYNDINSDINSFEFNSAKKSLHETDKVVKIENSTYIYYENFNLKEISRKAMENSKGVIFISSTGIAVRAISSFLRGKDKDPGVVVVDLSAKYSINILSGHLGGGNELTLKVSEILNCMPVITTASDNLEIIAPDILAKENNLIIEDLKKAKYIASLLIDEKIIGIKDDYDIIKVGKGYKKMHNLRENCIWITHKIKATNNNEVKKIDYSRILKLIRKDIILGIGCRKGATHEKLKDFIITSLTKYNLDIRAVAGIVSVEVKANEEGIIKLAEEINCPFSTFTREEIKTVQDKYDKSEFVLKTLGITGVCEPCVDLAGAEVIISKIKHEGMTLAIGVIKNIVE